MFIYNIIRRQESYRQGYDAEKSLKITGASESGRVEADDYIFDKKSC